MEAGDRREARTLQDGEEPEMLGESDNIPHARDAARSVGQTSM